MLARLTGYSSKPSLSGVPICHFDIELCEIRRPVITDTISLAFVIMISSSHKEGPLYRLCRAIRDAKVGDYAPLIGVEFRRQ